MSEAVADGATSTLRTRANATALVATSRLHIRPDTTYGAGHMLRNTQKHEDSLLQPKTKTRRRRKS